MPEVFEHFFSLFGTTAAEQLDLTVLDPGYRVFFEGMSEPVDVRADRTANLETFERIETGAGARLAAYLDSADEAYDLALRRFLYSNFDSMSAQLRWDVVTRSPRLLRLLTQNLEDFVADRFADRRLRQILGYPAVFLGTSPDRAPSMYHLMSRLDLGDGVLYPAGDFVRLVEALTRLAEGAGARLRRGATVTAVDTGPGPRGRRNVTGVHYRDRKGDPQ